MKNNEYENELKLNIESIKKVVPGNVYYKDETDSTNLDAKMSTDAPDKSLFLADIQSRGRGRMGRVWSSPRDVGICMSILLKPKKIIDDIQQLTLIAGLAVSRVIDNTTIKWPNDILIESKKVAGILTEMTFESNQVKNVVVGIGINVNNESFPDELSDKATSLFIENGKIFQREDIICDIVSEFFAIYDKFISDGFSCFCEEYCSKCSTLNKDVIVVKNEKKQIAKAVNITEKGELVVEFNGELEIINSQEVSVRGLMGYA